MRRFLAPSLAAVLIAGGVAPLSAADAGAPGAAAAAAVSDASPESAVLAVAQVLRSNDLKGFFAKLPATEQAKAKADWVKTQEKMRANPNDPDAGSFERMIDQLVAPDAEQKMLAEAEPKLHTIDPQELSQQMGMAAAFLPMMLQQPQPGMTTEQAKNRQALGGVLTGVIQDMAGWVLEAGIDSPDKLKLAVHALAEGGKALNVKSGAELRALPFEQFLERMSPMLVHGKAAAAVYGIEVDKFLESVTAKASGTGDARSLQVGFTAFGRAHELPLPVVKKDGKWVVKEDAFGAFKQMLGGGPGMGGPGMGGPGGGPDMGGPGDAPMGGDMPADGNPPMEIQVPDQPPRIITVPAKKPETK